VTNVSPARDDERAPAVRIGLGLHMGDGLDLTSLDDSIVHGRPADEVSPHGVIDRDRGEERKQQRADRPDAEGSPTHGRTRPGSGDERRDRERKDHDEPREHQRRHHDPDHEPGDRETRPPSFSPGLFQ